MNPLDLLEDCIKRFKTDCFGMIPGLVGNAFLMLGFIAVGIYVDLNNWLPSGVATGAALLLCAFNCTIIALEYKSRKQKNPRRGFFLKKHSIARNLARRIRNKLQKEDRGILWGKLRIPTIDREKMFMVVGNIGSGKTLTFRILMKDQLPLIKPGSNRRALIYDSKQDCVQILAGMGLECPMYILNPLDARHAAWDIAKDVDNNLVSKTFAAHLFPDNPRASTPFFDDAPRAITTAVIQAFIDLAPGKWTLRHLVLVLQSEDLIALITAKNSISKRRVSKYLDSDNTRERASILSSIDAKISQFIEIAACWDSAGDKKISIKDWFDKSSKIGSAILVLGNYEPARTEIDLVNGLFIDVIRQYGMALEEANKGLTWLFLDEFPEAGKFEGFKALVLRGRSKNIISVIGLQDISTLYAIYGREETEGFLPQIGNRAYLHLKSHENAAWASKSMSKYTPDFDAVDEGKFEDAVPPQQFQTLPEADLISTGLHGIYMNGKIGIWNAHYTVPELQAILPQPNTGVKPFILIDNARTRLKDWSEADARLFGIPFTPEASKPSDERSRSPGVTRESNPLDNLGRLNL